MSKSVSQLEAELGVALLERTTREVRLTEAGSALLDVGRDALAAADDAFERARSIGLGLEGTVTVGVTPPVGAAVREEVAVVLRDGARGVSVAFREVRPGEIAQLLREGAVDVVLARTSRGGPDVDSAALRPSPVDLLVPAGHRLAGAEAVELADLDGERLLAWSPRGTPYTDLLVDRLAAAGDEVEVVESPVTGGGQPPALEEWGAVALVPAAWPAGSANVRLQVDDDVSLPLVLLWTMGLPSPAVQRLRSRMGTSRGACT
ncbi:MAG: hypothetical protein AVDCRST_MAG85-4178 [uncultured Solirubrobacteraceae bacterium]|uniref:HTH lysR-type domain-containing protein n=1 Tax=uncultured Solirubrobacteraceae bacterium TaxID=1162706 RepID=A0A6J4U2P9_9ACTN|nr:MAG: hypothetical protein AVDCRST_MAG85-4178 [uncultured Solirubrobacteraceae bacterium]